MTSFVDKYSPKTIGEVVGQKTAISKTIGFLDSFPKTKKKAVMIYGSPGTGKTRSIHLVAKELGFEIVEIDAEEFGEGMITEAALLNTTNSASIFGKKKLLLIDGVEAFSNSNISKLISLIKKSRVPVVLVAIDLWEQKFRFLRMSCESIEFRKIMKKDISAKIGKILEMEKMGYESEALDAIAENCDGDLRAAINDLETACAGKSDIKKIELVLEQRDLRHSVFGVMQKIFREDFSQNIFGVFDSAGIDIETGIHWLSENICNEYKNPVAIADAYNYLSRSDVFLGRIKRRQHWGFYRYAGILSTAGVNVSRTERATGFVKYAFPSKLLRLSETKSMRNNLKKIAAKIAPGLHVSSNIFLKDYIAMFKIMLKKEPKLKKEFLGYGLTEGEIDFLSE